MSPYTSEKGDISTRTNLMVEAAKSKLAVLRARQAKRRRVILRHLFPSSDDCLLQIAEDYHLNVDYLRLRQLLQILGPRHPLRNEPDELVYKKRTILPVITRLKSSLFYRRLLFELERSGLANSLLEAAVTTKSDVLRSRLSGLLPKGTIQHLSTPLVSRVDRKSSMGDYSSLGHLNSGPTIELSRKNSGNDQDIVLKTYAGSATFLKGTQSANPHNDYCQHFVDTGERPQNFIRDTGLKNRFEEYPKLRELIRLKDDLIQTRATPPMYLRADLKTFDLNDLQSKFDVILIEPPLEEYHRVNGATFDEYWNWQEIERLEIEKIIAPRSFVWIWCGSGEGLDAARRCLRKWGFRRCEDICWIKTNTDHVGHAALEPGAVFQRTKEHCLMGIHGTVRRSTDGDFIHSNIDIDLIIQEAPKHGGYAAKDKPTEIFHIIEHFCLGRRRLHLFGRDSTLRPGWLTVGSELSASNFDPRLYTVNFSREPNGLLLGSNDEIERLRPKSPPPRHGNDSSGANVGSGCVTGGSISLPSAVMGQQQQQRHMPRVATHVGSVVPVSLMNSGLVVNSGAGHVQRRSLGMVSSLAGKTLGSGVGGNTIVSTVASSGLQPSLLGLPSSLGMESGHHHQQQYGNLSSFLSTQSGIGRHSSLLQSRGGVMSTYLVGQANVSSLAALQAAALAAASTVVGGARQPSAPTTVPFFPPLAVAPGPPLGWPSAVQPNMTHAGNLAAGMAALAAALAASHQQPPGSVIPSSSSSLAGSLIPGISVSQAFSLPGTASHLLLPAGVAKSATRPNLLATLAAAAAAAAATGSGATGRLSSDVFQSTRAGGNSTSTSLSRSQQQQHSWR